MSSSSPVVPPSVPAPLAPATVRTAPGAIRSLGPGLVIIGVSVLLTLVDQRTPAGRAPAILLELRPPTWIAGVLCIGGLCWLLHGLYRLADEE